MHHSATTLLLAALAACLSSAHAQAFADAGSVAVRPGQLARSPLGFDDLVGLDVLPAPVNGKHNAIESKSAFSRKAQRVKRATQGTDDLSAAQRSAKRSLRKKRSCGTPPSSVSTIFDEHVVQPTKSTSADRHSVTAAVKTVVNHLASPSVVVSVTAGGDNSSSAPPTSDSSPDYFPAGSLVLGNGGIGFGFLPDDASGGGSAETMASLNALLPKKSVYYGRYAQILSSHTFDGSQINYALNDIKKSGAILIASIMPMTWNGLTSSNNYQAVAVAKYCASLNAQGIVVYLRFAHEGKLIPWRRLST